MGQVYLAHDKILGRQVALKLISVIAGDEANRARVINEARVAAQIHHPNVVTIHDVVADHETPYIVSEYIYGESLDKKDKPLPWQEVLRLGTQLASGLAEAHRQGVLHRDIKPANAILSATGGVKLIDFGLAKWVEAAPRASQDGQSSGTASEPALLEAEIQGVAALEVPHGGVSEDSPVSIAGVLKGTPSYMAPELWDGKEHTKRSDVYSFGALLYELCTGEQPMRANNPEGEILRLQREDVDPRFAEVVNGCVARDPARRYASGEKVWEALLGLQPSGEALALPPGNPYRGLLAFEQEHCAIFFGRDPDVRRVLDLLRARYFVLLAGESGVGKSSLARAGVLARVVRAGLEDGRKWSQRIIVPGKRPLVSVANELAQCLDLDEVKLSDDLQHGHVTDISQSLRRSHGRSLGTIILFDQLEELITLSDPDEARKTAHVLAHLAEQRLDCLRILATVRGDYLSQLANMPELGNILQSALGFIRPLGKDAIRDAIVRPAQATGVDFESEAMVDELVEATAHADGGLPLLQFVLAELWDQRNTEQALITHMALKAMGGIEGALSQYADTVLRGLSQDMHRAARRILVRLVTLRGTRKRCSLSELARADEPTEAALEALVKGRLLVVQEMEGERIYEIAHEALLNNWTTLRRWLDEESGIQAIKERVIDAAHEWERMRRAREALWSPKHLTEARAFDLDDLPDLAKEFMTASHRAIIRSRGAKIGLLAVVILGIALAYGVIRYRAQRALDSKVMGHLQEAERQLGDTSALYRAFEQVHQTSLDAFRDNRRTAGETLWQQTLDYEVKVESRLRLASQSLEAARGLDPLRSDVGARLAEVLDRRAQLANYLGRLADRDELVERLRPYDGARHARWVAPVKVSVQVVPAHAELVIEKYEPTSQRKLARSIIEPALMVEERLDRELRPGSYVLTVRADDEHIEVRYPVLVRPGMGSLSITIPRPRKTEIPDGYIYIPEGAFLFGYGSSTTDERFREWYDTVPQHERRIGPYLIHGHETTFREWLDFVESCRAELRARRRAKPCPVPRNNEYGGISVELAAEKPGGWMLVWKDTGKTRRAALGKKITYDLREKRKDHDWRYFPVVGISVGDIEEYIQWLNQPGRIPGARLCREDEWERAARGADGRIFPHGDRLEPDDANFDKTYGKSSGSFGLDQVGSYPESMSPFGLYDMTGNVWEITESIMEEQAAHTDSGEQVSTPTSESYKKFTLRGGSFYTDVNSGAVTNRWTVTAEDRSPVVGFRVCAQAKP